MRTAFHLERQSHVFPDAGCNERRAVGVAQAGCHDHELIAAHAHDQVLCRQAALQALRDDLQQPVAKRMSAQVVDLLEMIQVDVQEGGSQAVAPCGRDDFRQAALEAQAVEQACQHVMVRLMSQLVLLVDQLPLGSLARRHVAQHEAGDLAIVDDESGGSDFHVEELPVLRADDEYPVRTRRRVDGGMDRSENIAVTGVEQIVDVHLEELFGRKTQGRDCGWIGFDDPPGLRIDQQHGLLSLGDHGTIAPFARGSCLTHPLEVQQQPHDHRAEQSDDRGENGRQRAPGLATERCQVAGDARYQNGRRCAVQVPEQCVSAESTHALRHERPWSTCPGPPQHTCGLGQLLKRLPGVERDRQLARGADSINHAGVEEAPEHEHASGRRLAPARYDWIRGNCQQA